MQLESPPSPPGGITAPTPETGASRALPALVATLVSFVLVVMKGGVWWLTGSATVLASMVDSAGDVLISLGNFIVVRAATRPADPGHPFGHGKLEHLAELFQSLLIAASGIFVVTVGLEHLQHPAALDRPVVGVVLALVSLFAAWRLSVYLFRAGERFQSPALQADSRHYTTDYLVALGVLAAFVADSVFESRAADPVISILIAGLVLKTATEVFLGAVQPLMDRRLSQEELAVVHEVVMSFSPPVQSYHDLLSRRAGQYRFVQLHVEMDADLTFREAHRIAEDIMAAIARRLPRTHVTVHADPWPEDPDDAATHLFEGPAPG